MESTVGMGEIMVAESPNLLRAVGIGSCIAVTLYDRGITIRKFSSYRAALYRRGA